MPTSTPLRTRSLSSASIRNKPRFVTDVVPVMPKRGVATILLVEDDHSVRTIILLTLRAKGYNVLEASCGREAVNMLETYRGPVQMLVTDVRMPHMGGQELAQIVTSLRPGIKTLYLSGYFDGAEEERRKDEGANFLQKPFATGTLVRKVAEILEQK